MGSDWFTESVLHNRLFGQCQITPQIQINCIVSVSTLQAFVERKLSDFEELARTPPLGFFGRNHRAVYARLLTSPHAEKLRTVPADRSTVRKTNPNTSLLSSGQLFSPTFRQDSQSVVVIVWRDNAMGDLQDLVAARHRTGLGRFTSAPCCNRRRIAIRPSNSAPRGRRGKGPRTLKTGNGGHSIGTRPVRSQ